MGGGNGVGTGEVSETNSRENHLSPFPLSRSQRLEFKAACGSCSIAATLAPEGHLRIAQRFIAGECVALRAICPVGTTERFNCPYGTSGVFEISNPAMNRWAIFNRPSGTNSHHRGRSKGTRPALGSRPPNTDLSPIRIGMVEPLGRSGIENGRTSHSPTSSSRTLST
jgi:hypothetical protein